MPKHLTLSYLFGQKFDNKMNEISNRSIIATVIFELICTKDLCKYFMKLITLLQLNVIVRYFKVIFFIQFFFILYFYKFKYEQLSSFKSINFSLIIVRLCHDHGKLIS